MKRTLALTTALAAGLLSLASPSLIAQAAAASAPATAPQAIPAKVAIIAFEQVVTATNEGQKAFADIAKKYEPKKAQIDAQNAEVESLKKQLQALPAATTDEERATRLKAIDTKEKALQRDAEDATNGYQNDLQEAYGKVAQKVGAAAVKYAQDNGFTLLLNAGGQQANPVLYWQPSTDISQAVVNAYNVSSGVAAPPPSAPRPRPAAPAAPKK